MLVQKRQDAAALQNAADSPLLSVRNGKRFDPCYLCNPWLSNSQIITL